VTAAAAPRRVVLASGNSHKAEEFARLLPGWGIEPFAGGLPPETGETFRDNALIKARHVRAHVAGDAWVLADDSGIAADTLGGAPGVRSARYAGEGATDAANRERLLAALEGAADRRVRYVAELVLIDPNGRELVARGELAGTAALEPRGTGGFGYDPLFVPDGEGRTVAEMAPAEKDAISHRARAAQALREALGAC
jgi:XTP/dITP diphosphohydrolase